MASAEDKLAGLLAEFSSRSRPVRVVQKRLYWHQRAADIGLRIVTLNGQNRYLTNYVTTLGHTIYVPDDWEEWPAAHRYTVLRHEAVHVAQFERYTWLGMVVVYGIVFFPLGLAYGRARLEWEAYAETLRATAEVHGLEAARSKGLHEEIVRRFTGPDYGWMWPFRGTILRWIRGELREIEAAEGARRSARQTRA